MNSWDKLSRKDKVLALVEDAVTDLMYYDRKESEDFPAGSIQEMLGSGEVTVDEMVEEFRRHLEPNVPSNKNTTTAPASKG